MAPGTGSKPADRLFRCVIFPTDCGKIPIPWMRALISLRFAVWRSRLTSLARELLGGNRTEETRRDGADMPDRRMIPDEKSSLPVFPPSQADECAPPLTREALFDVIEDGVCVQSLNSRIVFANSAFADIIGSPLEQIIGRPCAEVFG